jgi:hypothetical protein
MIYSRSAEYIYAIYQASVIYFSMHKVSTYMYEAAGITATPVGLMT